MSKHRHQQNRTQQSNRTDTSMSVGPEITRQVQEKSGQIIPLSEHSFMPSYDDIARRAFHIHEEKGGSDLENWLEAERSLKEEHHGQY